MREESVAQVAHIKNHSILQKATAAPLRFLILEDSEFDAHRIKRMLKAIDPSSDVAMCSSVSDFVEIANGDHYDVAIVDYLLPDGNGLEALRELHADETSDAPAAIMVTGEGDDDVAASAMGFGYSAYVTKSGLDTETLRAVIDEALSWQTTQSMYLIQDLLNDAVSNSLGEASEISVAPARKMLLRMLCAIRELRRLATIRNDDVLMESAYDIEFTCLNALGSLFEFNGYRERFRRPNKGI